MTGEKGATAETALLRQMLDDPRAGWSVGTFGAIAEFLRDPGEAAVRGAGLSVSTARGAVRIELGSDTGAVAVEDRDAVLFDLGPRSRPRAFPSRSDRFDPTGSCSRGRGGARQLKAFS